MIDLDDLACPDPMPIARRQHPARQPGDEFLGAAVRGGRVQFWSVSSLQMGDAESEGCPRKWWYRYVKGIVPARSNANRVGGDIHAEIERYLKTGDVAALGPVSITGRHLLPLPGPDLLVEHSLPRGTLTCAGIRVVGKIDLLHWRGINVGGQDVLEIEDPPGTVEVVDHKTTSDMKWAKAHDELWRTVQMSGYGKYAAVHLRPGTERARLTHNYFEVRRDRYGGARARRAEKRTDLVPVERLLKSWDRVEGVGRELSDCARETEADRVPANPDACGKFPTKEYPRGCPYRDECTQGRWQLPPLPHNAKGLDMGYLDSLDDAISDEGKSGPDPAAPPKFYEALNFIRDKGKERGIGFPALGGDPARWDARLRGVELEGDGLAGTGKLGGKLTLVSWDKSAGKCPSVVQLAGELGWGGAVQSSPGVYTLAGAVPAPPAKPEPFPTQPAPAAATAPAAAPAVGADTGPDPAKVAGLVPPDAPAPGTAPYPPEPEKKGRGKKAPAIAPAGDVAAEVRALGEKLDHIANLIAKACALSVQS